MQSSAAKIIKEVCEDQLNELFILGRKEEEGRENMLTTVTFLSEFQGAGESRASGRYDITSG